jgi:hypothetical protein
MLKNRELSALFISILLLSTFVTVTATESNITGATDWTVQPEYPIMQPDSETLHEWMALYNSAPPAYIEPEIERRLMASSGASFNLLDHLAYTPSERNQGSCGNCWVWAGTGVLEVALSAQEGVKDRFSIQYFTSCFNGGTGGDWACCGGWLDEVADWYSDTGFAVPWNNTNAQWQDSGKSCASSTSVPCGSISTNPYYSITDCTVTRIETHNIGRDAAVANIKNVLHQNKAVWFAFFLPTDADWSNFRNFWSYESEDVIWDPDFSCGHTWNGGGGHAVLCVGYNDTDPDNSYWIMVNSWGARTNRPNGIFYLDMNMNYDCQYREGVRYYDSFTWETLNVDFGAVPSPTPTPTSTPSPTPTPTPTPPSPDLGEAVDNSALAWSSGGSGNWFAQASTYYYGGDAAQSGAITHNQESWIQTTLTGPGTLQFYWKVSSEYNWDWLEFHLDGVRQTRISGDVNWQSKSFSIPSGSHTVMWRYTKDASSTRGSDCGWLDKVVYSTASAPFFDNTETQINSNAWYLGTWHIDLRGDT